MSSEFSSDMKVSSMEEGWKEPIAFESQRFMFHKVRIYGTLQLLKQPKPEYEGDLFTLESLRKEFNIAYPLNHPSIARYYRYEDNRLYEEYIDGVTLSELIESGDPVLSDPKAVHSMITQLFEAIAYLHLHGIVHRDIKPENIMVTHIGNRLKIIDFGAAESAECDTTPGFTAANLAPEQTEGNASFQTDIYQAGLVAQAITEKSKFRRKWQRFVAQALHPDPQKRFHSAEEALKAIPTYRKASRNTFLGFTAVFISVLVAGFILINRHSATQEPESAVPAPVLEQTPATPLEENVTPSLETSVSAKTAPATDASAESEEDRLKNEINRFVTDAFASRLKKICDRKPTIDENGFIIPKEMEEFEANFDEAINKSFEYGKKMASNHPRYRDFIEETLHKKIESVSSVYLSRFYEPNEKAAKKFRQEIPPVGSDDNSQVSREN